MADLINVGQFPNDATGDPARVAFQKINGVVAGSLPFQSIVVGPPTTNVPAITVNNQFGFDGIDINLNQQPGQGFAMSAIGASPTDIRGVQIINTQAGAASGTFGFLVGNDSFNTFIMGKTSSAFVGSKFTGSPAGEISFIQSGGNVPISVIVGATPVQVLGISNTAITMFNSPVTGGNTVTVSNTSAVSGDTARLQVNTPTSAVALYAANAAQAVAIVTGGPTGAQGVLRNLGAYPFVFGTNNTYRGQVDGNGTWTFVNVAAASNASIGAAGVQASWEFAGNGNVAGTSSLLVGQTAAGVSSILARGAQPLNIGTGAASSAFQITSTGNAVINIPAGGDGLTLNGVNSGTNGINMSNSGAVSYTALNWTNSAGGGFLGLTNLGTVQVGANAGNTLLLYSGGTARVNLNSNGALLLIAATVGDTLTVGPSAGTGALMATNAALTTGAGAGAGTLTNAPAAGNPTKWIKINDNGTIRAFPAW